MKARRPSGSWLRLLEIMARLRDPLHGCPWDQEQTFASIAPYTVEEAHEVADAIERGDLHDLKDELGDLLLQVVYHARMAEEAGHFAFADVAEAICEKMIRRHPHVFGDAAEATPGMWEAIKKAEREAKGRQDRRKRGAWVVRRNSGGAAGAHEKRQAPAACAAHGLRLAVRGAHFR